ncbi:MAG: caspase family protein [Proteobacteria bacterium]|jgi:hypothetical protein|nr:caspase family protein [Pseudomonadota bacterium]
MRTWILFVLLFCSGCQVTNKPKAHGVALVIGLTEVDPRSYSGWHGECPGTDTDARIFEILCQEFKYPVTKLINAQATRAAVKNQMARLTKDLEPGDLFVFFISCHGGQIKDINNDEEDGQDETICLWDGELKDDELLWPNCRTFFVTDSCNSGTNVRYRPNDVPSTGNLLHFGGCPDGKSSFGDSSGGTFTTALVDSWVEGQSYSDWFSNASRLMPKNQRPVLMEYGTSFKNREAMK